MLLGKLATKVGLGWLGRRIPDWGGWLIGVGGAVIGIYELLDPVMQREIAEAARQFFTDWREVKLGQIATVLGAISLVWSQRKSFKATVEPQIVTPAGNKVAKEVAADQNAPAVNSAMKAADNAVADGSASPQRPILKKLGDWFRS